jgi:5'-3' exonuclease
MGVLEFFGNWLNKKYRDCLLQIRPGGNIPSPDAFLIDGNSIFYGVVDQVYKENPVATKEDAFLAIAKRFDHIIAQVNPEKTVYISIDGVAGLCKQSQQRRRRFNAVRSSVDNKYTEDTEDTEDVDEIEQSSPHFDSIQLSAGTPFLAGLSKYFREYFSKGIRPYTVILDDMYIPGEGEHKIMEWIRTDKHHKSYMVYSPDADLVMLCLLVNKPNMFVLRVNTSENTMERIEYYIIMIDRLASQLAWTYQWQTTSKMVQPFIKSQFIKDIVLFMFFLGNDFLPHVACLSIAGGSIEKLLEIYIKVVPNYGFLSHPTSHVLNQKSIYEMMRHLAQIEPTLLVERYLEISDSKKYVPDQVLNESIIRNVTGSLDINMTKYRELHYTTRLHFTSKEEIKQICEDYFRGMYFVLQYYTRKIPTYDWYYRYHYPPTFLDLAQYASKYDLEFTFDYKPPLTLSEALFSIIPPSKYFVLPNASLQAKMNIVGRVDPDFSENFKVDSSGIRRDKLNKGKDIILLPMLSYNKIKLLLKDFDFKDPDPEFYTIIPKTSISSTKSYSSYTYTIICSGRIYPEPGEASFGALIVQGRPRYEGKKYIEYSKYIQYATEMLSVYLVGLNEVLLTWIKETTIMKKRNSQLFIVSENESILKRLESLSIASPKTKDQQRYNYLVHYIQTKLGYRLKFEIGTPGKVVEALELVEDCLDHQEDKLTNLMSTQAH